MKLTISILLIGLLGACTPESSVTKTGVDQCLRNELFQQCMKNLPKGPIAPHYNDWDEVVKECGNQVYYQALRKLEFIKPECRV